MSRDPLRNDEFSADIDETVRQVHSYDIEREPEDIRSKVVDVTSRFRQKAGEAKVGISRQAERRREEAAATLGRTASALHEKAGGLPGGEATANVVHGLADRMESTALYLREHDVNAIRDDVTEILKNNPVQTLAGAVVLGFLIGRRFRG